MSTSGDLFGETSLGSGRWRPCLSLDDLSDLKWLTKGFNVGVQLQISPVLISRTLLHISKLSRIGRNQTYMQRVTFPAHHVLSVAWKSL